MKKAVLPGLIIVCLFLSIGAVNVEKLPTLAGWQQEERPCRGYTILEYGKAIDCHGDTIALEYGSGFARVSAP